MFAFNSRQRNQTPNEDNQWLVVSDSVVPAADEQSVEFRLKNSQSGVTLQAIIYALIEGQVIRLKVNELNGLRQRFEAKDSLLTDIPHSRLQVVDQTAQGFVVQLTGTKNKAFVSTNPFRIDVYSDDKLVISGNQRGLFKFEYSRPKPQDGYQYTNDDKTDPYYNPEVDDSLDYVDEYEANEAEADEANAENEGQQQPAQPLEECTDSCWDEPFKSHTDTKPYGPMSVG
ncbi:unnamed protein product, partial [Oppiella nova]